MLGEIDGLGEGLREVGHGAGVAGFDVAAGYGGEQAAQGGTEVAGGEVIAGEEVGQVLAQLFSGLGLRFLLRVMKAEIRVTGGAGSETAAAIGE